MDKRLLDDEEYTITGATTIQFLLSENIKHKNVGIISQLPNVGIVYNGDCDGYKGTFDFLSQTLTLLKADVALATTDELSIILLIDDNESHDATYQLLIEIKKNTKTNNIIAQLLIEQNEMLKQIF